MLDFGVQSFFLLHGYRCYAIVSFISNNKIYIVFLLVCCGKTSSCGVFLIIQNIISLIFAIILIIFTSLFIKNPCLCYNILCKVPAWDELANDNYNQYLENFTGSCTKRTYRKLSVLKGLLSCAVLMLVSNILFIIVYIIAYISLRNKGVSNLQIQSTEVPAYELSTMINAAYQYDRPYLVQNASEPHYYSQTQGVISTNEIPSAPIDASYSHRF